MGIDITKQNNSLNKVDSFLPAGVPAGSLGHPVQYLKGIGPKVAAILKRQGIETVYDALHMLPRSYEDLRKPTTILNVSMEKKSILIGTIGAFRNTNFRRSRFNRRSIIESHLTDSTGRISLKWFNGRVDFLERSFPLGSRVVAKGTVSIYQGQKVIIHPELKRLEDDEVFEPKIVPIYVEFEKIPQFRLRNLIQQSLVSVKDLADPLPEDLIKELKLPRLSDAISAIHSPKESDNFEDLISLKTESHRRVIFDELFLFELYILAKRATRVKEPGISFHIKNILSERFREILPFKLTRGQEVAIAEIFVDMQNPAPMHRLLQGDVGSGKTIVAFFASLLAIENNYQVAFMVPTEILSEQHYTNAKNFLEPLGINVKLLNSSQPNSEKTIILNDLKEGKIELLIGTHALFQDDVQFKQLGLVIIDEQHRFGVRQRVALRQKGISPDLLVMTATPIPRTLSLSFYGDLDISTIRELPPGRKPISTSIVTDRDRRDMYQFLENVMAQNGQIYVVLPLIEESEKIDLKNAVTTAETLTKIFPHRRVGLIHGALPTDQKQNIMEEFKKGLINLLVSTTVIEVGVDVPNATVMVIEHAERFGLSQLHQLRGRVGRGERDSHCFLVTDPKYLNKSIEVFETTRRRLFAMTKTNDGFKLAEEDLNIRGPGELLGTRQAGLPTFKFADITRDLNILTLARDEALKILKRDPELKDPAHKALRAGWNRYKEIVSAS